jgi:hypothetical protein
LEYTSFYAYSKAAQQNVAAAGPRANINRNSTVCSRSFWLNVELLGGFQSDEQLFL